MRRAEPRAQPVCFGSLMLSGAEPMPSQDLGLAMRATAWHRFKRLGDPFVQTPTPGSKQGFICEVAEQRVSKTIAPTSLGDDEPSAYQPLQTLVDKAGCKIKTVPEYQLIEFAADAGGNLGHRFHRARDVEASDKRVTQSRGHR